MASMRGSRAGARPSAAASPPAPSRALIWACMVARSTAGGTDVSVAAVGDRGQVQADGSGLQALAEGRHVSGVETTGDEQGGQAGRDDADQEHALPGRRDRDLHQHEDGADDGPQLVGADVDDGLRGALSLRGQGRIEELVGRAEERVAEDAVPPARHEDRAQARVNEREPRAQARREGMEGDGAGEAQAAQGAFGGERLHGQGQEREARVEGTEEGDESGAAGEVGRSLDLEDVVDDELGEGGQADEKSEVAEVGKLPQRQKPRPRVDEPFLVGGRSERDRPRETARDATRRGPRS